MEQVLLKIIHMSLQASIVIAAIILARSCMRKVPKKYTYMLWFAVGFRLLCPFDLKSRFSMFNLRPMKHVAETTSEQRLKVYKSAIDAHVVKQNVPNVAANSLPSVTKQMTGVHYMHILLIIWLLGILTVLGFTCYRYIRLKKNLKQAIWLYDNIYESAWIHSPIVVGIFNPRIYLPPNVSQQEREYLVMHEQVHIRYGDYIGKLMGLFAAAIHWFNPIVWLAFLLYGNDIEMRCDEVVIDKLGYCIKKDYSMSLVSFASEKEPMTYVVVPLNFSKSRFGRLEVKMRIKNILGYKKASKIAGLAAVVMVAGLTVFCTSNAKETESAAKQEVTTEEASTQVANPEEELERLGAEDDCLHANVGEDSIKFVTAYISDDNQDYRVILKNVENDMANWSEEEKESYRKDIAEIQEREGAPLYICSSCAKKGFVKSEMTQEELEESLKDREPIIEEYAKKLEAEGLFIDNGNLHAYYQNNQYSFNGIMAADTNDGNNTFIKFVVYVNKEGWDIVQNTFYLGDLEKTDYGYKSTFVNEIGQRIEYEYHEADNVLISTTYFSGKEKG
ncbi:MAG: M56 family metallopeptidase [Lachnospiraceae bacterium]|nr:M56 family metallopeptidase [Lachnospiraceae bacterium]